MKIRTFGRTWDSPTRTARKIVDAAYTVHKISWPGLFEKVYEVC